MYAYFTVYRIPIIRANKQYDYDYPHSSGVARGGHGGHSPPPNFLQLIYVVTFF